MYTDSIAKFRVIFPDGKEQLVSLRNGQSITIGRDLGNDVVVLDAGVSRFHATISTSTSGLVIADMGSTNGTYVNGVQLKSMKSLMTKDMVNIGSCRIVIDFVPSDVIDSEGEAPRAKTTRMKPVSIAVIVATVRKYHDLMRASNPVEATEMLLWWKNLITQAVEEYNGSVDKVVGNHIVAIWVGEDARGLACQAAHAAQNIQVKLLEADLKERWKYTQSHPWKSSVVLTSGSGLAGNVGGDAESNESGYSIIGDPINQALAIEAWVDELGASVVIAESTAKLIKDVIILSELAKLRLEDNQEPIDVYSF